MHDVAACQRSAGERRCDGKGPPQCDDDRLIGRDTVLIADVIRPVTLEGQRREKANRRPRDDQLSVAAQRGDIEERGRVSPAFGRRICTHFQAPKSVS